jgi:hypothetical protein
LLLARISLLGICRVMDGSPALVALLHR